MESSDSRGGGQKAGSLHLPESLTTTFWVFTTWGLGFTEVLIPRQNVFKHSLKKINSNSREDLMVPFFFFNSVWGDLKLAVLYKIIKKKRSRVLANVKWGQNKQALLHTDSKLTPDTDERGRADVCGGESSSGILRAQVWERAGGRACMRGQSRDSLGPRWGPAHRMMLQSTLPNTRTWKDSLCRELLKSCESSSWKVRQQPSPVRALRSTQGQNPSLGFSPSVTL